MIVVSYCFGFPYRLGTLIMIALPLKITKLERHHRCLHLVGESGPDEDAAAVEKANDYFWIEHRGFKCCGAESRVDGIGE